MAEIITFRPTPEASEVLDRIKAEGGNVSKYLNELLAPTTIAGRSAYTYLYSYYPEPVKGSKWYTQEPQLMTSASAVMLYTVPIGTLNARRYKEFQNVLSAEGMQYHYFRIDENHTLGIVAPNREEASIEFAKYYTYDPKTKTYDRTSRPLPQVRYDPSSHTVVVIIAEKNV